MQRTYYVTGSQCKNFRLKKGKYLFLNMKNILLTSLLITTTSNAYSRELDCDIIELDDFQETKTCDLQSNETENIEEELIKHWKNSYTKKGKQFIDNEYN